MGQWPVKKYPLKKNENKQKHFLFSQYFIYCVADQMRLEFLLRIYGEQL